jgi:hypothetical protein
MKVRRDGANVLLVVGDREIGGSAAAAILDDDDDRDFADRAERQSKRYSAEFRML